MTPELQPDLLLTGGVAFEHWHEGIPSQLDAQAALQALNTKTITENYTVRPTDDYLPVDTSAASVTLQLPRARLGREIEVIKLKPANRIDLLPVIGEDVMGEPDAKIYEQWTALRLRGLGTTWVAI